MTPHTSPDGLNPNAPRTMAWFRPWSSDGPVCQLAVAVDGMVLISMQVGPEDPPQWVRMERRQALQLSDFLSAALR